MIGTRASGSFSSKFPLSDMLLELSLIVVKLVHEEDLVDLLRSYHAAPSFVNYKKEYTRLAAASDKVACPWSVALSGYSGFFHH
jgi:hypothetical protein